MKIKTDDSNSYCALSWLMMDLQYVLLVNIFCSYDQESCLKCSSVPAFLHFSQNSKTHGPANSFTLGTAVALHGPAVTPQIFTQ